MPRRPPPRARFIPFSYRIRNRLRSACAYPRFVSVFLDRDGLAALYARDGTGVFNLCLRTIGAREPAARATEAAFVRTLGQRDARRADVSAHLLAAARDIAATAGEATPEPASPVEEANRALPPAQREALALRAMLGFRYDAIGADRRAVAELLWRARLELRDRLAGSGILAIAAVAEPCQRTLPLIAMRLDGELRDAAEKRRLQTHLRICGKCRIAQDAMREADDAYRAWPREQPPPELGERLRARAEETWVSDPAAEPAA
jgi:hypothetical protein